MHTSRKIPFIPTIFEHSARIINRTPSETALSEELLEEAQVQSYLLYKHDAVTVGIDVYNIEAEALGCEVKFHEDNSIPGVIFHPFSEEYHMEAITFSTEKGRIGMVLNAAERVKKRIGSYVNVSIGISGPFSICAELTGFEKLITDCIDNEETVHLLLEKILAFQKEYCKEIIKRGLGVTLFESWAAPPLVSPGIYRNFVAPYEKELITHIKNLGVLYVPLVIGGDTLTILDDMLETGTTLLISDYKADIKYFVEKAKERNMTIRGNIDPKLVERGPKEEIIRQLEIMLQKINGYDKFVVGTGVLPYNTPPENVIAIREYLNAKS
ncbi:MAG: uroporphyrinogen decarboxylase family protein [Firmicutes bacterium]|nr:uroporphyrinogen decarboxylase family protein [Bacillota bacterium]